jgi:molybdenum cofactor guanylyltransferase
VAVVAVDMPFASPSMLRLLAARIGERHVAVPVTAQGTQPLHAVYSREAIPVLHAALSEGRLALRDALAGLRVRTVERAEWIAVDPSGRFASNLNRPEDLAALAVSGGTSPHGTTRGRDL